MSSENVERILIVLTQIPRGRVATYGQIARLAGIPKHARQVGRVLKELSDPELPWHRVVNSRGEISQRGNPECERLQRERLETEKIEFDSAGRVSLPRYAWRD